MFHFFLTAISWNVLNVFLYKIILQTHQACLFYTVSHQLFGLAGTLFSTIYFLISITNAGFDYFIITHHHAYTRSREAMWRLLPLFVVRILCSMLAIAALFAINQFTHIKPIQFLLDNASAATLAVLIFIFISESIKKSLDSLAQMSFLQKSITIFDLSTLALYLSFVWGTYFIFGSITLPIIFVPMAIISTLECFLIFSLLRTFYRSLPVSSYNDEAKLPGTRAIVSQQVINYANQIAKALFSPNFFILILAYHLGVSKAGYVKLFTDIIILLYMLLNRSFGLPSAALFSSIIKQSSMSSQILKDTFIKITNWYIQFLYVLASTMLAIMIPYLIMQPDCSQGLSQIDLTKLNPSIILFVFAGFIEYISISYEKWYLTQNKAWLLAIINSLSIILLLGYFVIAHFTHIIPSCFILAPIVLLRLCTIIAMIYVAYRQWDLRPHWGMRRQTAIASIIAITIALCFHYL